VVDEVIFLVEEAAGGGYTARALGVSVFTEADDLASLHEQVRDAMRCHFDEGQMPMLVRLRVGCERAVNNVVETTPEKYCFSEN
jgi:hypothetical protein